MTEKLSENGKESTMSIGRPMNTLQHNNKGFS
jgi:hypothetical protein